MNNDKIEGGLTETIGKVKEVAAKLMDDKSTAAEGTMDKVSGAIQKGIGEVKDVVKNATK